MTYEKFMKHVKEQILSFLPEEYANADVTIQEVTKNNDQKFYAMCIRRPEDRLVPNIYMEDFYQMYQNEKQIEDILVAIARTYQENIISGEQCLPFQVDDYESLKDRLYVTVLNRNNNQNYLKNAVCRDIPDTDITAVAHVLYENRKEVGITSFLVHEDMLKVWGITKEVLHEQALENTERLFTPEMINIKDVLFGCEEEKTKSRELLPYEQYVLSNEAKINGAAVMLYPNLLQEIGEATKGKFFILPSSIHELILIKDAGEMSAEEIQRMVMEVNRTQVDPQEVLSDEVYSYDYREEKLTMATNPSQSKELIEQLSGMCDREDSMQEEQKQDFFMDR